MNDTSLQTSFWVMIALQTIGSVDMPGSGARKMPSPRSYVAILIAWLVLQIAADIGPQARRGATALGWLLVITGMVTGPFGTRFVSFMQTISSQFGVNSVNRPATVQTSAANAQQLGGTP